MEVLDLLTERGLSVAVDGDQLVVGPSDRLTDELRRHIREHKSSILQTLAELRELAGDDWPDCERDPGLLAAFSAAVQARKLRERGEVPPGWDDFTACNRCGPVPIFAGCPSKIQACPWCWNTLAGRPVPRPAERGPNSYVNGAQGRAEITVMDGDSQTDYQSAGYP